MARPLLCVSSNVVATGPLAGHIQLMSSSPSRLLPAGGEGVDDNATPEAAPLAGAALASGRVSTFAEPGGLALFAAFRSVPGAATRNTWPTSIRFGFSRLFHLTRSFQFWPVS